MGVVLLTYIIMLSIGKAIYTTLTLVHFIAYMCSSDINSRDLYSRSSSFVTIYQACVLKLLIICISCH